MVLHGFLYGGAFTVEFKEDDDVIFTFDLKSVQTYMDRLALDEVIMEDIAGVEQPSKGAYGDQAGWVNDAKFKRFVVGAQKDKIVDPPAIEETAKFVGSEIGAVMIPNTGHNIMLSPQWKEGAKIVLDLVRERC